MGNQLLASSHRFRSSIRSSSTELSSKISSSESSSQNIFLIYEAGGSPWPQYSRNIDLSEPMRSELQSHMIPGKDPQQPCAHLESSRVKVPLSALKKIQQPLLSSDSASITTLDGTSTQHGKGQCCVDLASAVSSIWTLGALIELSRIVTVV